MKISVCITTYNEEASIGKLLISLLNQTKKPDEIMVVDSTSVDKTVDVVRHFQSKTKRIKLLIQKSSRAKGRNIAIDQAKNEIIALTDAGCVAHDDWLEKLTKPFLHKHVDLVAGFYRMKATNSFQKAASVFLGVTPGRFDYNFLPSARSMAFTKSLWKQIGGFPEDLADTAEDTLFNYKAIKSQAKIVRVKGAIVEWEMPKTLNELFGKIYKYARGDAKSRVIVFPTKGLSSHNIKVLLVFLRYIIFTYLLFIIWPILLALLLVYCLWAYKKAGLWGVILQFTADFAVMAGFVAGIIA